MVSLFIIIVLLKIISLRSKIYDALQGEASACLLLIAAFALYFIVASFGVYAGIITIGEGLRMFLELNQAVIVVLLGYLADRLLRNENKESDAPQ